jgi:hypothetical protein
MSILFTHKIRENPGPSRKVCRSRQAEMAVKYDEQEHITRIFQPICSASYEKRGQVFLPNLILFKEILAFITNSGETEKI